MNRLASILVAIVLLGIGIQADEGHAEIYSDVSYNSSTNTVTAYSYTYPDYNASIWYTSYLSGQVYDSDGNYLTNVWALAPSGGMATDSESVTGNGCDWYMIRTGHWLERVYYVQYWYAPNPFPGYHDGYYDPYQFQAEGGNPVPYDYWYELQGPGPEWVRQSQQTDINFTEDWSEGNCNLGTKISRLQYKIPNTAQYAEINETLYVLKGTTVEFKAVPNPENQAFQSGQPSWSGTSGANGTGETKQVSFTSKSSTTTDFKTVVASAGTTKTVKIIVYELGALLLIADQFTGRSQTEFGPAEIVDYYFSISPNLSAETVGNLVWSKQSGNGELSYPSNGIARYTHPDRAGSTVLRLTVQNGPSAGEYITSSATTVEPTDAFLVKTSNIKHDYQHLGGLFKADIYMLPTNVSFKRVLFGEGTVAATATGVWSGSNGQIHQTTSPAHSIGSGNAIYGCKVNAFDTIGNWTNEPRTPPIAPGYFSWDIPWHYYSNETNVIFTNALHFITTDANGDSQLGKKNAGMYTINRNDPTTDF